MNPRWIDDSKLRDHYVKRMNEECHHSFGVGQKRDLTIEKYNECSLSAYNNPTFVYLGVAYIKKLELRLKKGRNYYPRSKYYVNKSMIVSILSPNDKVIFTCYHEHFNSDLLGCKKTFNLSEGLRKNEFIRLLEYEIDIKILINFKGIKGFSA